MSTASHKTIQVLEHIVKVLPVGTNLALLHLMWALVNGSFLKSRGAVHSALAASGFDKGEIRRSWQALRYGVWHISELINRWRQLVLTEGHWQPRSHAGYRPISVDITAFWRPRLQFWGGKFFHRLVSRAVTGVGFGIVAQIGAVASQRVPLLKRIIRVQNTGDGEAGLHEAILRQVPRSLDAQDVFVHDAGLTLAPVQSAGIPRFVLRLAANCTARRNYLPPPKPRGRPAEYGRKVRPLARKWKERLIPATPPDVTDTFQFAERTVAAKGWLNLVRSDQKVEDGHETFSIWVFSDPLFADPMVLGTNLSVEAEAVFRLYLDRWPVEQPPLVAKQMLGLHRQFVFAPTSCQRLPELALLAGNILTYLATTLPPIPTGFWDRRPKKRPGGCDERWNRQFFQKLTNLIGDFGKSSPLQPIYQRELQPIGG